MYSDLKKKVFQRQIIHDSVNYTEHIVLLNRDFSVEVNANPNP